MQTKNIGYIQIFFAGVLWGTIGIFIKQMELSGSTPAQTSFLRMFFAFLIMLAFCIIHGGMRSLIIDRKALLHCALLGIVCQGISNVCYAFAVTMAGVSVSAVLLNISPVFTLLFSAMLFSEKITGKKVFAIVLNIVGCIFTATNGHLDTSTLSLLGVIYGAASGVTYGLIAIFGRVASDSSDPFVTSTYSYLTGSILLFICMRLTTPELVISGRVLGWGFLYALIPTSIAYALYFMGLQKMTETSKAPVITSVMTIVAAFIGVFLYKEKLGIIAIAGIVLVMASIVIINSNEKTPASADSRSGS